MLTNYIITAFRNITRHKLYAAINIGGLAVGIAACILIFLFVRDELSFDQFFANADRIYQLEMTNSIPGRAPNHVAVVAGPVRGAIQADLGHMLEASSRMDPLPLAVVKDDLKTIEIVAHVDAPFLDIFKFDYIVGTETQALAGPTSIVLTRSMAEKFFDSPANALGQTLTLNHSRAYNVSAVIEDIPDASHMAFDGLVLITAETHDQQTQDHWFAISFYTYFLLAEGASADEFSGQLDAVMDDNMPAQFFPDDRKPHDGFKPNIINVTDIHLEGANFGQKPGSDLGTVYGFAAIAFLVLAIACINFINLATARSLARAREVAVRKVVGATRKQIISQFLGEATMTAGMGLILALILVEIAMPWFNQTLTKVLAADIMSDPTLFGAVIGLLLIVGLGAGSHPALVLSSFRPATVLRANSSAGGTGSTKMRAVLVTLQFAISTALIIGASTVYLQTDFARNMNLGFEKDNRIIINGLDSAEVQPIVDSLRQEIENHPDVLATSISADVPGGGSRLITVIRMPDSEESILVDVLALDYGFFEVFGIEAIAGRLFDQTRGTDAYMLREETAPRATASVVINESALPRLGFSSAEEALGKTMRTGQDGGTQLTIIGVVSDMQFLSIREQVAPMMFLIDESQRFVLSLHYSTQDYDALSNHIDATWDRLVPGAPITKTLFEDSLDARYASEATRAQLLGVFAFLAIVVSSLGLFGLASYSTARRRKEVGVRKVLGARVRDIVGLMVWQFSIPVLVANIIAWPVAWYFMRSWLEGFAYRIELSPTLFLGAGLATLLIAWLTVGGHAFRAARSNPIKALRYE